ncbi:MAG: hypothetical protein LBG83_01815 [Oscillospiraceae bacterium]|nr:hypothetical protein [Oscillospiraceae bacterium]
MDDERGLQDVLAVIDDEADRKCYTLQEQKKERRLGRYFSLLAAVFVLAPAGLVLYGVAWRAMLLPLAAGLGIAALLLSPVLFLSKGDTSK